MNSRERVLTTLRRSVPDRVPKDFVLSPAQLDAFRKRTGAEDPVAYFGLDVRRVYTKTPAVSAEYSIYHEELPEEARIDEWGVAWLPGSMYHFERIVHPMANITDVGEVETYPFPDVTDDALFVGYRGQVEAYQAAGFAVVGLAAPLGGTIFWPAYKLRGMERVLMDLMLEPEIATVLLDRVAEVVTALAAKVASMGVDILWTGDDFGTQRNLMMSESLWKHWFKGRIAKVVQAAKNANPDVIFVFHSDGTVAPLIPHLIEIGVDVLNPVQPECMDPALIKEQYGDRLAFWGAVGTQTTMPFGTPAEVKGTVRHLIATVGRGGGYVAAPTHLVEPEVPWENLLAFVEAVDEYGHY